MEHTFLQVVEKLQFMEANTPAGEQKVKMHFDKEIIEPLCDSNVFTDYTREIKDACKQIVDKNSHLVATAFINASDYSYLYDKIEDVCGKKK